MPKTGILIGSWAKKKLGCILWPSLKFRHSNRETGRGSIFDTRSPSVILPGEGSSSSERGKVPWKIPKLKAGILFSAKITLTRIRDVFTNQQWMNGLHFMHIKPILDCWRHAHNSYRFPTHAESFFVSAKIPSFCMTLDHWQEQIKTARERKKLSTDHKNLHS